MEKVGEGPSHLHHVPGVGAATLPTVEGDLILAGVKRGGAGLLWVQWVLAVPWLCTLTGPLVGLHPHTITVSDLGRCPWSDCFPARADPAKGSGIPAGALEMWGLFWFCNDWRAPWHLMGGDQES